MSENLLDVQPSTADAASSGRAIALDGLLNVRDLGGLPTPEGRRVRRGLLVRSDNLSGLTDAGAVALVRHLSPALVIDLRTEHECAREGRGLAEVGRIRYVNLPLQPKAALSPEQAAQGLATNLYDDYVLQVRDNGEQLLAGLSLLAEEGALPAVVHCTAGKDRTGVLVALLLDLLGVEREAVVADYAETTRNMPGILARIRASPYFRSHGLAAAPDWIFASEPATMRDFLAFMDRELGGTARWAVDSGLPAGTVERLRDALLEPRLL